MGFFKQNMQDVSLYFLYIEFISLCLYNILASFQSMWWFSLNTCCTDLDISRHPCTFCRCSEVLPGKLWCDHPPCTPYRAPGNITCPQSQQLLL